MGFRPSKGWSFAGLLRTFMSTVRDSVNSSDNVKSHYISLAGEKWDSTKLVMFDSQVCDRNEFLLESRFVRLNSF